MRGWRGEKWMKLCSERALILHCCKEKSYSELSTSSVHTEMGEEKD